MPDYKWLSLESDGVVTTLAISRPGDRNSIDSSVMAELVAALAQVESGGDRALIVTGGGSSYFVGGADGIEMMQCTPDQAFAFSRRFQQTLDLLEASPLITCAAINGLCFGGGFELALACDLRVAAEKARIGLPEVKVGLIPGGGGTQRLPALVGRGLAMEMILTGKLYPGKDALAMGLVNRCLPNEELLAGARALLDAALAQPQYALRLAKAAVQAAGHLPLAQGLQHESLRFRSCLEHDYFPNLMREQLKSGSLVTTAKLPQGFLEEK